MEKRALDYQYGDRHGETSFGTLKGIEREPCHGRPAVITTGSVLAVESRTETIDIDSVLP